MTAGNRAKEGGTGRGRGGEGSDARERDRERADMSPMAMGTVLGRSLTEALPLTSHPIALRTAISALRFAIRNPLTNYYEVTSHNKTCISSPFLL
jgi:hypothetical protein